MPDRVVKPVNDWGIQSKNLNRKNNMELLNRPGKKFDWENKELDGDENVE